MSNVKKSTTLETGGMNFGVSGSEYYVVEGGETGRSGDDGNEDLGLYMTNRGLRKENNYLKEECKYLRKRLDNLERAVRDGEVELAKTISRSPSFTKIRLDKEKKKFSEELEEMNVALENENYVLRSKLRTMKIRQCSASPIKDLNIERSGGFSLDGVETQPFDSPDRENLLVRTFLLSIEIKRLHRLLRKMSNHCGELEKALTVKMSPQEDTNSHLNQDYEEELVELNNQVILQNERLVLKDKYIEEQRKLLEELQRKKEATGVKMMSRFKEKELDFLEKINRLKQDNKDIKYNYDNIINEKNRQYKILQIKFENYKISVGDY